jgi:hypothetical protein
MVLLLAGVGGILGFLAFKVSREVAEIGRLGEAYLRSRPEAEEEFGALRKVERKPFRFDVQLRNDRGGAYFAYDVEGEKGPGDAEVWLERNAGAWRGVGAVLRRGGRSVTVGEPGLRPPEKTKPRD